jgi:hypothetical protein
MISFGVGQFPVVTFMVDDVPVVPVITDIYRFAPNPSARLWPGNITTPVPMVHAARVAAEGLVEKN